MASSRSTYDGEPSALAAQGFREKDAPPSNSTLRVRGTWNKHFRIETDLSWVTALFHSKKLYHRVKEQLEAHLRRAFSFSRSFCPPVRPVQAWGAGEARQAQYWIWSGLLAAVFTVLVSLPQLIVWQRLYGTWLTNSYLSLIAHTPVFCIVGTA